MRKMTAKDIVALVVCLGLCGCAGLGSLTSVQTSAQSCQKSHDFDDCANVLKDAREFKASCAGSSSLYCKREHFNEVEEDAEDARKVVGLQCSTSEVVKTLEVCRQLADDPDTPPAMSDAVASALCRYTDSSYKSHAVICAGNQREEHARAKQERAAAAQDRAARSCTQLCASKCDECAVPAACEPALQRCLNACGPHYLLHCAGATGP